MSTIQQATREAERRFPVRIRIGIRLKVALLDQTNAWLDANCGVDRCHRAVARIQTSFKEHRSS